MHGLVSPLYSCGVELVNFSSGLGEVQWSGVGMSRLVQNRGRYPLQGEAFQSTQWEPLNQALVFNDQETKENW